MIEPLYTLRDVDVPVGARTRVRARIEDELARAALPKRHVGRYAFAAAVVTAAIAFVAWPRPPVSSQPVVVPAGTQMDFAVATGHSVVHGPAQVGLDAGGLSLASGRVDAQGKLRVRGPSCDVMVDGTAEVSVTDAKLTVRVFAGSVEIVPPVVTCERIDLTPPAGSPTPSRATPTSPVPTAPTPSTVTPPATITASASPVVTPTTTITASASPVVAPPRPSAAASIAESPTPRPAQTAATRPPQTAATRTAPLPAATAVPRESATKVARVESPPAIPHAAPAVPSLERIDPPPPPVPHADSAPKLAPPPAPPPVARASTPPTPTTTAASVPASSLAAEELAAALAEYRTAKALETSEPDAAVRAWHAWRAHRSNTPLAHGADLRLLALLHSLHRDAEAAGLAREFLQRFPHSPRRADVERLLEGAR